MSGLNWMYCGPFGMILTDSLFLVTSEEKEKEVVSGECSSTSPESTIKDGEEESSSSPSLETGFILVQSLSRVQLSATP